MFLEEDSGFSGQQLGTVWHRGSWSVTAPGWDEGSNVRSSTAVPFDAAQKNLVDSSNTDSDGDDEPVHGNQHTAEYKYHQCTRTRTPILPSPPHMRLGLVLAMLVFSMSYFFERCGWKLQVGLFWIVRPLLALGIGWFADWLDPTLDFGIRHELEL